MSRNKEIFRPLSLAQHFDAPEEYIGHFGWLCGYSADALFLNDATERFTRLTNAQRAHHGRIALAIMLDPGNEQIGFRDAPGVLHLPITDISNKPFRLLHAKVALLGFRHQEHHDQWRLRLLVSTGNWTRQTLEESLDLVWRIDVDSESLRHPDADIRQDCTDIEAAWALLAWTQPLFDTRLLEAAFSGHFSEAPNPLQEVSEWVNVCSSKAQGQPRVFDNRRRSLLSQLSKKINTNGPVKRNYLAMGSGFYETSAIATKPPDVPIAIIDKLREAGLLTAKPEVDLYVNPTACQAIATSVHSLKTCDITVRPGPISEIVFGAQAQRSLHAKFLFSANYRNNSNACTSAWIYLGSGNLTKPGFCNKMCPQAGNLEAGVVFTPNTLYWCKDKTNQDDRVVTNLLPIQWTKEIDDTTPLSAGSSMVEQEAAYVAPPVAWFDWSQIDGMHELRTDEPRATDIQVLDSTRVPCPKTSTGFQWYEEQPREVRIRWTENGQHRELPIPVVDQYARIAATKLPAIDIDEAWWQLASFPHPPNENSDEDDNDGSTEIESTGKALGHSVPATSYPIRRMMELIECIASKQTEILEMDWALWCNRLEQTLGQASDSANVKYFRDELKLNPLSPLHHPSFRPTFAETNDTGPGKLYNDTLTRIKASWKVDELNPLGKSQ